MTSINNIIFYCKKKKKSSEYCNNMTNVNSNDYGSLKKTTL